MKKLCHLLTGAALSLAASTASAQEIDLTMVMIPGPGSTYSKAVLAVPERIGKATDGRVKITINNSLVQGNATRPLGS